MLFQRGEVFGQFCIATIKNILDFPNKFSKGIRIQEAQAFPRINIY